MLTHDGLERQRKAPNFGRELGAAAMQHCPPFDSMALHEDPGLEIRPPLRDEIAPMLERAAHEIGAPLAVSSVVRAIVAYDPQSVWLFLRAGRPIGTFALLYLNGGGVAALSSGCLDLRAPPLSMLAAPNEKPAGIYFWAMLARGRAASGVAHVFRLLRTGRFTGVDLWAFPYTADGRRFADRLGFVPAHGAALPGLMCCVRGDLPREKAA